MGGNLNFRKISFGGTGMPTCLGRGISLVGKCKISYCLWVGSQKFSRKFELMAVISHCYLTSFEDAMSILYSIPFYSTRTIPSPVTYPLPPYCIFVYLRHFLGLALTPYEARTVSQFIRPSVTKVLILPAI